MNSENVYQKLPHNHPTSTNVGDILSDLTSKSSSTSKVMNNLKLIHVDRYQSFVHEDEKKKKKKEKRRREERKLTCKQKKELKVYDIPKEAHNYVLFEPLSQLWQGYMANLLMGGNTNFQQKLIKSDFHGAPMTVIQSKNPSYVGVSGIMIQETLSVFKMITKENKLKSIPKNSCIFKIYIEHNKKDYVIYGQHMVSRPAERAVKKFKPKPTISL
ncbi:Rof/RNase P-like protein [Pilobolus umbonatus]|nr:Rof/RNase P-like protein [Pilobolus umbonatus]